VVQLRGWAVQDTEVGGRGETSEEGKAAAAKSQDARVEHRGKASEKGEAAAAKSEDAEVEDRGEASEEDKAAAAKSGEEIYIGFDKSDYAPRKGRKGRVLTDDSSRYPPPPLLSSCPHRPLDDDEDVYGL